MSPRQPIGEKAMTSAERIQRSRWINKFEETAVRLLDIVNEAPVNLTRQPDIPAELVQKLIPFINTNITAAQDKIRTVTAAKRFLKLGNGNQVNNKKKALAYVAHHINAEILDKRTLKTRDWGRCHFSAYTHATGAMISTPNSEDQNYGGKDWHNNDHIILFRELTDGRCMMYVSEIKPLFDKRSIGHHGVRWEDIDQLELHSEVMQTSDVISEYEHQDQ